MKQVARGIYDRQFPINEICLLVITTICKIVKIWTRDIFRTENINHFCCWWQKENVTTLWLVKYRVREMKPLTSRPRMCYCAAYPEISYTTWGGDRCVKWWFAGQSINTENTLLHFHFVHYKSRTHRPKHQGLNPSFRDKKSASNRLSYNFYHYYLISTLNKMCRTPTEPKECSLYHNCNPMLEDTWAHNWKHSIQSRVPYEEKQRLVNKTWCRNIRISTPTLCPCCT
jgi:hypothetical protein